jgi:hypothetical protein
MGFSPFKASFFCPSEAKEIKLSFQLFLFGQAFHLARSTLTN